MATLKEPHPRAEEKAMSRRRASIFSRYCGLGLIAVVAAMIALPAASTAATCRGKKCDTTPPSTPTELVASGQTASSITLTWKASSDNVGVKGYDLYRNGVKVGWTSGTSRTFSSLACGKSYTLAVEAFDAAGNRSGQAALTSSTSACIADTTPPSTPTELAASGQTASSMTLAWKASTDNVGVAGYDLYLNGKKVGTTTGTSYTFSGLACATSYTLAVDAYDAAGNVSAQASLKSSTSSCGDLASALPPPLPPSTGTTFYVSTIGSDSNPGTLTAPWRTIQKALNVLLPGQQALVRAGTYTQDLVMSRAGTASAPITVAAYPGETVVLHAASTSGDTYPIQITGAYFRLQGFVIENSLGTSAANVYLWGGANHIELSGNEIRYGQDQGIFADNTTSNLQMLGNRIHDNGWNHVQGQHQSHGIYVKGGNDLMANNVIYNHAYGFGIQIYPANHDTIVTDNTIASSAHSSIVVGGSGGVYNITIRNNILYDDNWGVEMDSTCPSGAVYVDHNVIYSFRVAAIEGGCSRVDTSGGNILVDPLFVNYAGRDLHLQASSPAIDRASSPWSETSDFDKHSRPGGAGPDIGAFER